MRFESPNVRKRLNDAGFHRLTASAYAPQKMAKADCSISLENRRAAMYRGFEPHSLRQNGVAILTKVATPFTLPYRSF